MCSAALSWAKLELPGAGWRGRVCHAFASSQLKGLMLSPARGMLSKQDGDDVPAGAKQPGRAQAWQPALPAASCGPEAQRCFPRALLEPKLGWGGQESISALAPTQALSLHLVEYNIPAKKREFACPRREGHISLLSVLLMIHPSSTPSLPTARLQKSSSQGEWGEIRAGAGGGWNRTTSQLGGKPGSHWGFQLPCGYPNHAGVWQWWQENF